MTRQQLADIGFATAIVGLIVTALSLTPLSPPGSLLPWPLLAGSFIYLMGSFCLLFNARGPAAKPAMAKLRYVRIGIIIIIVITLQRMMQ